MKLKLWTAHGLKKLAALSLAATLGVGGTVGCGGDDEGSGGSGGGKGGSGGTGGGKGGTGGTGGIGGGGTGGGGTGGGGTGGVAGSAGSGGVAGSAGSGGVAGSAGSGGATGGTGGSTGGTGGSTGGTGGSTGGTGGTGGGALPPCVTPTFAPPAGTYTSAQSVVISTTTPGATIYYTTDGTNPNLNSVVYSSPIAVTQDMTLRAMCNVPGSFADSTVGVAAYTITQAGVQPPTPNPAAGTQNNDFLLSLTSTTAGATICFTLDGSTPVCTNGVCQGTAQTYNAQTQIPINGTITNATTGEVTVNAVACKAGAPNGAMPSQKYTLQVETPQLAGPAPGTYAFDSASTAMNPLLSSATTGAVTARWTSPPAGAPSCASGTLIAGNLPVNWPFNSTTGAKTWSFAACKAGYKGSAVYTADYKFKLNAPTQTPGGGTYAVGQNVAIGMAANTGATGAWRCTTSDGSTPTCGATASTCGGTGSNASSILVNDTGKVLKSIACGPGYEASDVTTSTAYTMQLNPLKFTPPTGTPVNAGTGNITVNITQDGSGQAYSFICYSKTAAVPDCTCTASGLTKVNGNAANGIVMTPGTLSAVACDDGSSGSTFLSATGSASYQSASAMAAPVITPATGAQSDWVDVTLANADTARQANLCYTTDGSEPAPTAACASSGTTTCTALTPVAPGPGNTQVLNDLVKATNVTVKAKACDPGAVKTLSATASITYQLKVANPTLTAQSPAPGAVPIGSSIAWTSATAQAPVQFYYTTDGSTPTCVGGGTSALGTGFHMVNPASTTIKVIACSAQMTPSDVVTWTYSYFMQKPEILPVGGVYNDYIQGSVTNVPSNTIGNADHPYHSTYSDFFCYTFDGSTPTCTASGCGFGSNTISCGPGGCGTFIPVSATLKIVACSNNGLPASAVASETYQLQVGPITLAPDPASPFTSPQNVTATVNPAPVVGGGYTLCHAEGAVSIPPQPNFCGAAALETYLGGTWDCTDYPTGGAKPIASLNVTTSVSAIACKQGMVWSTVQKTYSFNPYSHTINIDGANDFNATNEGLDTTGADTAYLSWDANNVYVGYSGFTFASGETVDVYFGNGVAGTTTPDGAGLPTLPNNFLHHLVWKNTAATAKIRQWNPTGSAWEDTAIAVSVGYTGGGSTYVEFAFARNAVGSPTILRMAGGLQNAAGNAYVSVWPDPPNTTASWTQSYLVELLGAAVPKNSAKN